MEITRRGPGSISSGLSDYKIDVLKTEVGGHDQLDLLTSLMNAAGNDTRMRILYLLWRNKEVRVNDLAIILDVTTPAVSQQLKKLREHQLVCTRRDAQTVYYRLNHEASFVCHLIDFFENLVEPLPVGQVS